MARLPSIEDLGERPIARPARGAVGYQAGIVSRAVTGAAAQLSDVAAQIQAQERDLARQQAALAEQRYKNFVTEKVNEFGLRVASGEFQAQRPIDETLQKISEEGRKQFFSGISGEFLPTLNVAADSVDINHKGDLHKALFVSQQQQQVANLYSLVEDKIRGTSLPGGDVDEAAKEIDYTFETFGRVLPPDVKALKKREALDRLYDEDISRKIQRQNTVEGLTGLLAGVVISPNLSSDDKIRKTAFIQNRIEEVQREEAAQRLKLETAAKQAITNIDNRLGTGVQVTPEEEQIGYTAAKAAGPVYEQAYLQAVNRGIAFRQQVTNPEAVWRPWLDGLDQAVRQTGASQQEVENVKAMRKGLEDAEKLYKDDWVSFAASYSNLPVGEINWQSLSFPGGSDQLSALFAAREIAKKDLYAQRGGSIGNGVLSKAEADAFKVEFDKANAEKKQELLTSLSSATDNRSTYVRAVGQALGEGNVFADAGALLGRDELKVIDKPWGSNAVTLSTKQVGSAILRGQELIDAKTVIPPDPAWATAQFQSYFGDSLGAVPADRQTSLMESAIAYGIGSGLLTRDKDDRHYDEGKFEQALRHTIGEVAEYGDRKVVLPWGMSDDDFEEKADKRLGELFPPVPQQPTVVAGGLEVPRAYVPPDEIRDLRLLNVQDGVYDVFRGNERVGAIDVLSDTRPEQPSTDTPLPVETAALPTSETGRPPLEIHVPLGTSLTSENIIPTETTQVNAGVGPRGIRNNNPGNIRESAGDKTQWQGERATNDDNTFEEFKTPEDGIRALAKTLLTYNSKYKARTIEDVIRRWAPPSENKTPEYIAFVSSELDVDPREKLDFTDKLTVARLAEAIIKQENNGEHPYTPEQILGAVSAAYDKESVVERVVESAKKAVKKPTAAAKEKK